MMGGRIMLHWSSGVGCIAVGSVSGGKEIIIYGSTKTAGIVHDLIERVILTSGW